jgi:hypothetical protein
MTPAGAQRPKDLWSACGVAPDVCPPLVDRLGECVAP